jgi:hypothetical protein
MANPIYCLRSSAQRLLASVLEFEHKGDHRGEGHDDGRGIGNDSREIRKEGREMTPPQISKIWTATGLALLYYAINSWLVSQGGSEIFGLKLVVASKVPAAVLAIPVCSVLLLVVSLVGLRHATLGRWCLGRIGCHPAKDKGLPEQRYADVAAHRRAPAELALKAPIASTTKNCSCVVVGRQTRGPAFK